MEFHNLMVGAVIARSLLVGSAWGTNCRIPQPYRFRRFERIGASRPRRAPKCGTHENTTFPVSTRGHIASPEVLRPFFNCGGIEWMVTNHKI